MTSTPHREDTISRPDCRVFAFPALFARQRRSFVRISEQLLAENGASKVKLLVTDDTSRER